MNSSNHIIKTASLDFVYNGKTDGFAFQQEVKEWFEEFMLTLDPEFEAFCDEDTLIRIDQLELELELSGTDWRQQAAHKVREQLKDKLRLIRAGAISQKGYVEKKIHMHFKDSFLFYLQRGYLPWQASTTDTAEWSKQLEELVMHADEEFVRELKQLLRTSSSVQQRLMSVIPFQSAIQLFRFTKADGMSAGKQLVYDLQLFMKIAVVHHLSEIRQMIYQLFLNDLAGKVDRKQMQKEFIGSFRKKLSSHPSLLLSLHDINFQTELFQEIQKELSEEKKQHRSRIAKSELTKIQQQKDEQLLLLKQQHTKEVTGEEIYINNAGLVILAAFIPALFEKTGLAVANEIKYLDRAVCFLQFLVTESANMMEYELVLPKIICGVPIEQIIDTGRFHPDKALRKEADDVLTSVIEHWNILQNTSVNGLRESFLKRNGKLTFDGKDWLLQVEQQPYDMLLQHLPWNISIIKLPWMGQLLKTEWFV